MTVRSLILGLDVSPRRMGWGVCDLVTGEPVACGMQPIDLPSAGWAHQQVERALTFAVLAWEIAVLGGSEVQAIYVEQPAFPRASGPESAYNAGRAVQAAVDESQRRWPWAPIEMLQPSEWRSLAKVPARRSVSVAELSALWPSHVLPKVREIKPEVYGCALYNGFAPEGKQDAADAACIAVAGWHRNEDVIARAEELAARIPTKEDCR